MQVIEFNDEALRMWQNFSKEPENQNLKLRLYIEGKGCDGFFYGLAFDEASENDKVIPFSEGLELIIDADTAIFCKNVKIVWNDDEKGRGFLVSNLDERKYRGKFYKRKAWQDLLENKNQS